MKWSEIRRKHPDKFILIGDISEKKISDSQSEITGGEILEVSDDGKAIMEAYRLCKKKGMNVLFSLPTTPEKFIITDIPYKGILI